MEHHELGHYYTLGHLTQITGFTDRTLRTYLAKGILVGEKINGVWHFTETQLDSFLHHPSVRPGILAKHHATVYDFLLGPKKQESQACIILDLPDADRTALSAYFCNAICQGEFRDLRFSFDAVDTPRVILSGPMDQVIGLVNSYKSAL